MKKIRLIAVDLDGTLLKDDKTISQYTLDILNECIKNDILIVPCTGRPLVALPDVVKNIKGIKYIITSNGASTIDNINNKVIRSSYLEREKALYLINSTYKIEVWREVCIDGVSYAPFSQFEFIKKYLNDKIAVDYLLKTRKKVEDINSFIINSINKIERISFFSEDLEELEIIRKKAEIIEDISITYAMPRDLEIGHKNATKKDAINFLIDYLEIEKENVLAFGDAHNDLEMIKGAGIGVAMGNSNKQLKDSADIIADTNNFDGVAKIIETFLR